VAVVLLLVVATSAVGWLNVSVQEGFELNTPREEFRKKSTNSGVDSARKWAAINNRSYHQIVHQCSQSLT